MPKSWSVYTLKDRGDGAIGCEVDQKKERKRTRPLQDCLRKVRYVGMCDDKDMEYGDMGYMRGFVRFPKMLFAGPPGTTRKKTSGKRV